MGKWRVFFREKLIYRAIVAQIFLLGIHIFLLVKFSFSEGNTEDNNKWPVFLLEFILMKYIFAIMLRSLIHYLYSDVGQFVMISAAITVMALLLNLVFLVFLPAEGIFHLIFLDQYKYGLSEDVAAVGFSSAICHLIIGGVLVEYLFDN